MEVGITGKMLEAIHDYIVCRGDITESDYLFVSHARGYKEAKLNPVMVSRIVKRRLREIIEEETRINNRAVHTLDELF